MASGSVHTIFAEGDGVFVGPARILAQPTVVANGVVYSIDNVLTGDSGLNGSAIPYMERLAGFGPFNKTKVSDYCGWKHRLLLTERWVQARLHS